MEHAKYFIKTTDFMVLYTYMCDMYMLQTARWPVIDLFDPWKRLFYMMQKPKTLHPGFPHKQCNFLEHGPALQHLLQMPMSEDSFQGTCREFDW